MEENSMTSNPIYLALAMTASCPIAPAPTRRLKLYELTPIFMVAVSVTKVRLLGRGPGALRGCEYSENNATIGMGRQGSEHATRSSGPFHSPTIDRHPALRTDF